MKHKISLLVLATLLTSGCSLIVPTHEGEPPDTIGQYAIKLGALTANDAVIGPETTATNTDNEETGDLTMGYAFAFGLTDSIELGAQLLASFASGTITQYSLKWQYLGDSFFAGKAGDWTGSIKLAYVTAGGYQDTDTADNSLIDELFVDSLEATGSGATLSWGYRVTDWFQPYFGAKGLQMKLEANYSENGSSGTFIREERDVDAYGGFLGASLRAVSSVFGAPVGFEALAEFHYMNVPKSFADERFWYQGSAFGLNLMIDL